MNASAIIWQFHADRARPDIRIVRAGPPTPPPEGCPRPAMPRQEAPVETSEPLYVTCRSCSSPVPTGLPLTSAVYEIPLERTYTLTCPTCGTVATYTKAQFHLLAGSR